MKFSRKDPLKNILIMIALLAYPQTASAHFIGGQGFSDGLLHPFIGVDHVLAMVAVGVLATQLGRQAIWKIPTSFVVFMIMGGATGIMEWELWGTEFMIALSVLFLGIMIALAPKLSVNDAAIIVGLFALFHGYAHGTEMPFIANPVVYAIGFVIGTTTLHIAGVVLGYLIRKTSPTRGLIRLAGASMSVVGLLLVYGNF